MPAKKDQHTPQPKSQAKPRKVVETTPPSTKEPPLTEETKRKALEIEPIPPPVERATVRPGPVHKPIVTLTTDIGTYYASQMKAVLLRTDPEIRIVDITHDVGSHQVMEGAFLLRYSGSWFPHGTIHVAVVDPGVGGDRAPIAIACADGSTLIGPDNGVLAPLAQYLGEPKAFKISIDKVASRASVSNTFHGRDIFAPAAGLIARGMTPDELGEPCDYLKFELPKPGWGAGSLSLAVLHVDHFGNVVTNLPSGEFREWYERAGGAGIALHMEGRTFRVEVARSYEELQRGSLGMVGSSFGMMELAINKGRARDILNLRQNSRFEIHLLR